MGEWQRVEAEWYVRNNDAWIQKWYGDKITGVETGWYFGFSLARANEGDFGPYKSLKEAKAALEEYERARKHQATMPDGEAEHA